MNKTQPLLVLLMISCASLPLRNCFAQEPAQVEIETKAESEDGWIQLFNGKDMDDWLVKIRHHELGDNFANTFRVEDGLMKVRYDGYGDHFKERFGHIHYKAPFSHYLFRVEYRFVGKQCPGGPGWATRNSGVMIHGEDPKLMGKDQDFPASIEVQLLGGDGQNKRTTSNLCTPGTNVVMGGELKEQHCHSSTSKTYHGEQWVTAEIEVRGNEVIKHILDGEVVLEYTEPQLGGGSVSEPGHVDMLIEKNDGKMLHGGFISLQSESHPVDFRKVEIKPLPENESSAADEISKAVFRATFDDSPNADVAGGDSKIYTAASLKREKVESGIKSDAVRWSKDGGRNGGGALQFLKKTDQLIFFNGRGNLPTTGKGFQGTVSFWMKLDPKEDLPDGYVDPLQITDKKWNDASFFVDFDNHKQRDFRLGVFSDFAFWNPKNRNFDNIPNSERPMVTVESAPFSSSSWTHVVFTWQSFNIQEGGKARLYLNGKSYGQILGPQHFTWDPNKTVIMLGINYGGWIDDLTIFDRALSEQRIESLTSPGH